MDSVRRRPEIRPFPHATRDRAGQDGRMDRATRARRQQPGDRLRICEVALVQRVNFTEKELEDFLNRMLEAERAGAKALVVFMNDWPRNGAEWKILRGIHEDEAHNCALIG